MASMRVQNGVEAGHKPSPSIFPVRTAASQTVGQALKAAALLEGLGQPNRDHLRHATELLESLPEDIARAAREPFDANALVFALLLSGDERIRATQLNELRAHARPELLEATTKLYPSVSGLDRSVKLALVELAVPTLRRLTREQYGDFAASVRLLVESDRSIDLFEYALQKMLRRHLEPNFNPAAKSVIQYYVLKPLVPDCAVLLSALAHLGHDDRAQIESAFRQGVQQLRWTGSELRLLDLSECNLPQIDSALDHLNQAGPQLKRLVLHACAHAVAADGQIQLREAELLRAIADALDCPMPPFVG